MVDTRSFPVTLKNHWNNFRQSIQPYLTFDYDRCLELLNVAAGIRPFPGAEPWKRTCLTLYRLLGFYQFIMSVAKVGFNIRNGDDILGLCASGALLAALIAVYAKVFTIGYYDEAVRQSKIFVDSNHSCSGDPNYDAAIRRQHATLAGKGALIIFILLSCDQVILMIPNSTRDSIYGIPEEFHVLGTMAVRILQAAYVFMYCMFWGCGYFSCPITVMPLLNGLKHELLIVARSYETIAERGQAHALNGQKNAAATSRKFPDSELTLKQLKEMLEITMKQHAEVLKIVHLVQPLVSHLYFIIYYSVMMTVSLFTFVVIRSELALVTLVVIGASLIVLIVECYIWCRMIDSIEETMETIAGCVAPLAFRMQHSMDNHSEYIEMRTSLMIIQLNASQTAWFSCGGIFPISVESFGDLCMVIYKFATFLLNFD